MPGSNVSGSYSQYSMVTPRRGGGRIYHTVAPVSEVDETLFGGHSTLKKDGRKDKDAGATILEREAAERNRLNNRKANRRKEEVQVMDKDFVRNLAFPEDKNTARALVMHSIDFDRIMNSARVQTDEEKKQEEQRQREILEETMNGMETRRSYMRLLDKKRLINKKINGFGEEEEGTKSDMLKRRALQQLHEQEDEIKRFNELIRDAKVHAIRDAQIVEREHIKHDLKAEDRRINQVMEGERNNALRIEEEIERKRKHNRYLGAAQIMDQISENERDRMLEIEEKDQENRKMRKYLDQLHEEEAEKIRRHRMDQEALRQTLNQCNADLKRKKELSREQEKLLEQEILEYQRELAHREEMLEMEQAHIRQAKEKETARLRSLQERTKDEQAERDALRAKRAQEQLELEWRRREALEERRKIEMESELARARGDQLAQKQHFRAVEAVRDRAEFERVLRVQREQLDKQRKEEDEVTKKRQEFSTGIRTQIRDKERERIRQKNEYFDDGLRLEEEARQRQLKLEEVKLRKLEELRAAGIHDKYVKQVERKINHHHLAII